MTKRGCRAEDAEERMTKRGCREVAQERKVYLACCGRLSALFSQHCLLPADNCVCRCGAVTWPGRARRPAKSNTRMMLFSAHCHMAKHNDASCNTQHLYDAIHYTLPHGKVQQSILQHLYDAIHYNTAAWQSTASHPATHNTCMMPFATHCHMAKDSNASCYTQHLYDAVLCTGFQNTDRLHKRDKRLRYTHFHNY